MAFLAAVPAAEKVNDGGGSLVALNPDAGFGPELEDYLNRYRTDAMWMIGLPEPSTSPFRFPDDFQERVQAVPAASAEDAALRISAAFWESSGTVVMCGDEDYASALMAAPLAALLDAPLLYVGESGVSDGLEAELERLGAERVLVVGEGSGMEGALALAAANEVLEWVTGQGMDVDYLAAVNPLDRADSKVVKLSMAGAQLAAGRGGLVVPLAFEVEWKKPFKSVPANDGLPEDFRGQEPAAQMGLLDVSGESVPFVLANLGDRRNLALHVDLEGTDDFEGPYFSGDILAMDGRDWVVSLGQGTSYHDADVHLTWPSADVLKETLEGYYGILGAPPAYLCLVGLPDAVPHGIVRGRVLSPDTMTDLPFARVGGRESADISVGRLVAEDVWFGSLYAARVLTYEDLLDDSWAGRATQAEWENGFCAMLENVGFDVSYRLTSDEIPWAEEPSEGQRGVPAASFPADSPAASSGVLIHLNHSWNFELGRMMKWDAEVLLAPVLVESGGCGTTALDQRAPGQLIVEGADGMLSPELAVRHRSVVSRALRLGAVGFVGGSRAMSAQQVPLRHEFWNGVLAGESVGAAHRRSQNAGLLIVREHGDGGRASGYEHNLYSRMLIGDPAVSIHLPETKRSAPARTVVDGDRVTLHAPGEWDIMKLYVPPDWTEWVDRDIFVARGAGAYALCFWGPDQRDEEIPMVAGEFRSDRQIRDMKLIDSVDEPLGWSGMWHTERNRDGSYTHRIGARMLDLDQETGEVLQAVDSLEFVVEFK